MTSLDAAIAEAGLIPGKSPSPLLPPNALTLFTKRAARLRSLAPGHNIEGWLSFIATLVEAQAKLIASPAKEAAPEKQWLADLAGLLATLPALPGAAETAAAALRKADEAELKEINQRLEAGHGTTADLAAAPFLAAAEQLAWTRHAAKVDAAASTPPATAHVCPVCGQPPVAGMIHVGGESSGLRYLHCGCCGSAWHHVRATCVACGDMKTVSYQSIEGGEDGVRAECCDACRSALKLFLLEKNPAFEPVADDLASLTLDILIGEAGYNRIGGNPFLVLGS